MHLPVVVILTKPSIARILKPVKFKNGTTKEYKDGKVTSRTIYHENGQPASTKYKDENGRYYKKVEYDKSGNKIDEKVYE